MHRGAPTAVQLHHVHALDEQRQQAVEIVALDGPVHGVGRAAQQRAQLSLGHLIRTTAVGAPLRLRVGTAFEQELRHLDALVLRGKVERRRAELVDGVD